jgi:hypothetical protein
MKLTVMVGFFYYRVGFGAVNDQLADCHDNYGSSNAESSILSKLT